MGAGGVGGCQSIDLTYRTVLSSTDPKDVSAACTNLPIGTSNMTIVPINLSMQTMLELILQLVARLMELMEQALAAASAPARAPMV